jgi:hypothetical protein
MFTISECLSRVDKSNIKNKPLDDSFLFVNSGAIKSAVDVIQGKISLYVPISYQVSNFPILNKIFVRYRVSLLSILIRLQNALLRTRDHRSIVVSLLKLRGLKIPILPGFRSGRVPRSQQFMYICSIYRINGFIGCESFNLIEPGKTL